MALIVSDCDHRKIPTRMGMAPSRRSRRDSPGTQAPWERGWTLLWVTGLSRNSASPVGTGMGPAIQSLLRRRWRKPRADGDEPQLIRPPVSSSEQPPVRTGTEHRHFLQLDPG